MKQATGKKVSTCDVYCRAEHEIFLYAGGLHDVHELYLVDRANSAIAIVPSIYLERESPKSESASYAVIHKMIQRIFLGVDCDSILQTIRCQTCIMNVLSSTSQFCVKIHTILFKGPRYPSTETHTRVHQASVIAQSINSFFF